MSTAERAVYEVIRDYSGDIINRYTIERNGRYVSKAEGGGWFTLKRAAVRRARYLAKGTVVAKIESST